MSQVQRTTKKKKIPTKLHLSIPPKTAANIDKRIEEKGFLHYSEYVRALVRADLSKSNLDEELVARLETEVVALKTLVENLIAFYQIHAKE